jgi:hypothetical protein
VATGPVSVLKLLIRPLIAVAAAGALLYVCWLGCEYRWRLGFIPASLHVHRVLYAKEKVWGLGPGGNEAGIIVYELPADAAQVVARQAAPYLSMLPGTGRSQYQDWRATPIDPPVRVFDRILGSADICDVICEGPEDPGLRVDPQIVRLVNHTLARSGAYYSGGSNGLLIIAPATRRAVFVYAK